ncbi:MAG: hypothetical protein K2H57_04205, partial [Duncaniella sp.]|nr:hypothetical protein [Duncaniella sp.]
YFILNPLNETILITLYKIHNSSETKGEENKIFLRGFKVGRSEKYGLFDRDTIGEAMRTRINNP